MVFYGGGSIGVQEKKMYQESKLNLSTFPNVGLYVEAEKSRRTAPS